MIKLIKLIFCLRELKNKIEAYEINLEKLKEMDPEVYSVGRRNLCTYDFCGAPKAVMDTINKILIDKKIKIFTNTEIKDKSGANQVSSKMEQN